MMMVMMMVVMMMTMILGEDVGDDCDDCDDCDCDCDDRMVVASPWMTEMVTCDTDY